MVYIGHKHSIRSSGLLTIYLLFTFAVDILKCRSYLVRRESNALGGFAAATASLRFILLIVEERSKRKLLFDENLGQISGSEATSGCFTRSLFLFFNPMFMSGFSKKPQNADMEKLGQDFSSKALHAELENQWERDDIASSKRRLFWACFYAFRWDLLLILVPRLISIGITFAHPFLIELVIETAELDAKQEGYKISYGKRDGMQFATGLIYITSAVTKVSALHLANRLATKVRGALIAKLMDKTHKISEREAEKSAALTHMSFDIEDIARGFSNFIDIPMVFLEVAAGVFLLSRFIGASCFFALLPVLGTNYSSFLLSRKFGPALARWSERIELRIAKTTEVLKQLPSIKMLGLGPTMRDQIHSLRVEEMETSITINDKDEKARDQQSIDALHVGVLHSLNLWVDIHRKGGLDTMLAETGYSKGELQLFSIARAIVRRREIGSCLVLIDEAAINLDALRDEETRGVLEEAIDDCTVLTIAHREETIRRVDFTVALDDGEMATIVAAR
ncbi:hypothetical protein MY4038_000435 [Beauveria bassiana]